MDRPATRPRKKARTATVLALVRVDGTRIRQQIKREYEKVVRGLEKARREIEQHQKVDLPEFDRWLHREFGALLTKIRETSAQVEQQRLLLLEIETELLFGGGSARRAYARVMNRRRNPAPPPDDFGEPGAATPEGEDSWEKEFFSESQFNFDEEAERFGDGRFGHRPRRTRPEPAAAPGPTAARIKELYRALARLLHPDAQQEMTWQKAEWWHQTQAAYQRGDVEQLEVILSLCEIESAGTTAKTSLSILQRISAQLKKTLRALKRQLTQYRRETAWKFKSRNDLKALGEQVRREMNHDLTQLTRQLRAIESQLAQWATARPHRERPLRGRQAAFDTFDFFF